MLKRFADHLAHTPLHRHLFFLACAVVMVLLAGYYFGTFDQAIHIPFLKKFADPGMFPNDAFFEMRFQHYSYFWLIWQPFYQMGLLEIALFLTYLAITYATFWAVWELADTLFRSPLAALLSTLAFVLPHIGFGAFPVTEFSLLNRTFVLPFLLWALILYLRGRTAWAYLLLGALYNLHVVSVNFAMGMVVFDSVMQIRRIGWKKVLGGWALFVLGAAPVLIWKLTGPGSTLAPDREWFNIVGLGYFYHLFFPFSLYPHVLGPTLCGISAFVMFWATRRYGPEPDHNRTVTYFLIAVILILAVQTLSAWFFPITLLMQLQVIRAGLFALIFGYLYFANYLAQQSESDALAAPDFYCLAAAMVGLVFPALLLLVWGIMALVRAPRLRRALMVGALVIGTVGSLVLLAAYDAWRPGINVHIFGPQDDWYAAQVWARENTPRDALFITPPHLWSFYDSEWRVFSERSTVVTLSELLEIALVPDYVGEWRARFERVAPGALAQFRGDYFENQRLTRDAYYRLTAAELRAVAAEYAVDYLVVEKPHIHPLPIAYENAGYVIYDLRQP